MEKTKLIKILSTYKLTLFIYISLVIFLFYYTFTQSFDIRNFGIDVIKFNPSYFYKFFLMFVSFEDYKMFFGELFFFLPFLWTERFFGTKNLFVLFLIGNFVSLLVEVFIFNYVLQYKSYIDLGLSNAGFAVLATWFFEAKINIKIKYCIVLVIFTYLLAAIPLRIVSYQFAHLGGFVGGTLFLLLFKYNSTKIIKNN